MGNGNQVRVKAPM